MRSIEQGAGRREFRARLVARGHELHRIGRENHAGADGDRAGHVYGNAAGDGCLAENRASGGALRHVRVAENADPCFCFGEMLDHVRAAEAGHDHRFVDGQHAMHCRRPAPPARPRCLCGRPREQKAPRSRRRRLEALEKSRLPIGANRVSKRRASSESTRQRSSLSKNRPGLGIGIAGDTYEQQFQGPRRIQRQNSLRLAKQRDAAIRDLVRRAAEFAAGQQLRQRIEIDESILMQSDSRLRAKDAGHGLIDSRERQSARVCRFFQRCQRRVGHGRLQKQIHSGENCLHGGFGGSDSAGRRLPYPARR